MARLRLGTVFAIAALAGILLASSCSSGAHHRTATRTQAQRNVPPLRGRKARQRIVFVDAIAGEFGAVYSIRLDGHGLRRLAREAYEPAPSPDRTRLAYTEGNAGSLPGGIFIMRSNGGHKRPVVTGGESIQGQPAWSPDGRTLVFVSTVSPAPSGGLFEARLFTVRADGSRLRRLKEAPSGADSPGPSWIDARHILVTSGLGELAILSSQTGRVDRRISLPRPGTQPAPQPAALSPNGKEIAYTDCFNDDCTSTVLNLITLRGDLIRRIRGGRSAAWSHQGALFYACCGEPSNRGQKSRIFFVPAGGGAARPVTPDSIQADSPAWIG
jgi:Tol biopolymer transport system component